LDILDFGSRAKLSAVEKEPSGLGLDVLIDARSSAVDLWATIAFYSDAPTFVHRERQKGVEDGAWRDFE